MTNWRVTRAGWTTIAVGLGLSISFTAAPVFQAHAQNLAPPPMIQSSAPQAGPNQPASRNSGAATTRLPLPYGSRLSLKQAISIALEYQPKAAQAAAESDASEAQVREARSYLAPQVYAVSEYLAFRLVETGAGISHPYFRQTAPNDGSIATIELVSGSPNPNSVPAILLVGRREQWHI